MSLEPNHPDDAVTTSKQSPNLFPGVKVILVETTHPGNIGAAARAMKNMGLTELVLVNPLDYPNMKSIFRSASALDVVKGATVVQTVEEAVADCHLVIGTSARDRRIPWPMLTPRECGEQVSQAQASGQKVGLMFGREARGLKNEELQKCQFHVNIPTGEAYSSLNLAMAVQVICYEVLQARLNVPVVDEPGFTETSDESSDGSPAEKAETNGEEWDMPYADAAAVEHLLEHLEKTMIQVDFHDPDNPRRLMIRIRRLFTRIRPDQMEVNILRGFLSAINKLVK